MGQQGVTRECGKEQPEDVADTQDSEERPDRDIIRLLQMAARKVNSTATARLKQDYMRIMKDPVPYIQACPLPSNILEWHFIVEGPPNSPYEGGIYHGKLIFPREFPFKPPSIYMLTPNGRFKCNSRLCLSISDFHPDTWNPAWSVSTILTGLLSFMLEKSPTLGSIETSLYTKRQLSAQSLAFNLCNQTFCELFPEVAERIRDNLRRQAEELKKSTESANQVNRENSQVNIGAGPRGDNNAVGPRWQFGATVTNMLVIVGFAAFAFVVKHIITNVVETIQ